MLSVLKSPLLISKFWLRRPCKVYANNTVFEIWDVRKVGGESVRRIEFEEG